MRKRRSPVRGASVKTLRRIVADLERRPLDEGKESRDLRMGALQLAKAELSQRENARGFDAWAEPLLEKAATIRASRAASAADARAALQAGATGWVDGVDPAPPEEAEEPPVSPAKAALARATRSDAEKARELVAWPTWTDRQEEN